jgi:hypothetical protein
MPSDDSTSLRLAKPTKCRDDLKMESVVEKLLRG